MSIPCYVAGFSHETACTFHASHGIIDWECKAERIVGVGSKNIASGFTTMPRHDSHHMAALVQGTMPGETFSRVDVSEVRDNCRAGDYLISCAYFKSTRHAYNLIPRLAKIQTSLGVVVPNLTYRNVLFCLGGSFGLEIGSHIPVSTDPSTSV